MRLKKKHQQSNYIIIDTKMNPKLAAVNTQLKLCFVQKNKNSEYSQL